jgi:hypothetical protein
MRKFQKCTKSHEELPKMHKMICGTSKNAQNPIFGSSLWDFVPFWKFLMGFCAFLEDPGGVLCIFGSSSWDFTHFWKFLVGFCAFQKCTKSHEELTNVHKIPRGSSKNAQNPMIDFE